MARYCWHPKLQFTEVIFSSISSRLIGYREEARSPKIQLSPSLDIKPQKKKSFIIFLGPFEGELCKTYWKYKTWGQTFSCMEFSLRVAQGERKEGSFVPISTYIFLQRPGLFCITLLAELLTGTANLVEHQGMFYAPVLPLSLKATLLTHLL